MPPLELWPGLQVCAAFEASGEHLEGISAQWCGFVRLQGQSGLDDSEQLDKSLRERSRPRRAYSESTLEARLRTLRTLSMSTSLPFPDWFRIRAYPQEIGYEPTSGEVCIDRPLYRFIIDHCQ